MKNFYFLLTIATLCASIACAQGRSVSMKKKIKDPYKTASGEIIEVGTSIRLLRPIQGANEYSYVSVLNNFNEPIAPAPIRMKGKTQPVIFFKEEDGVMYLFTKFFAVSIECALEDKEIEIVR